jgi:hypothetical protein
MIIDCLANPDRQQVDVIITTVPWTDSAIPLMAPAVLKPIVERAGMTCLAIDLNAEIYKKILPLDHKDKLYEFFFDGRTDCDQSVVWLENMMHSVAMQLLTWKPKFIGLSLFSYVSRSTAEWLCYFIKKLDPDVKILLGGAGCLEQFTGPGYFADDLIERKLADFHIRGDGEHALHELLMGNREYVGINSLTWKELDRSALAELPIPDYCNYNFSIYNKKVLPIQGSRGCVRRCTFCDYIENWKNFQWRDADAVFDEMLAQYQKYKIRTFKFQDTLVNGNLKEFNRLVTLLSEHNTNNPDQSFKWGGFYIFRNKSVSDNWELLAKSGADALTVGIENLNEDIRYAIGKKFNNESITWHLEQAQKHNVSLNLLFLVGYVNETQQHIDFAKSWFEQHVYLKDKLLLNFGGGLGIFPNTHLDRNKNELGVQMIGDKPHLWINQHTGSTPKQRAEWVQELNQHCKDLGYNVAMNVDNHFLLEQVLKDD